MNRNRAIAEQGGQPERRAARFPYSKVACRRPVTFVVRRTNRWSALLLLCLRWSSLLPYLAVVTNPERTILPVRLNQRPLW
jgi:hypothetical protein